jgi:hypothetical protein
MRAVFGALMIWTAVVLVLLWFDPGSAAYWSHPVLCMRLVGHSAACEATQARINDAWQWLHVWPLLIAMASGYVTIAVIALQGRRRRSAKGGQALDDRLTTTHSA